MGKVKRPFFYDFATFTGKKLSNYFNGPKPDWRNAWRLIAGLDKAGLIAGHAKNFDAAVSYTV